MSSNGNSSSATRQLVDPREIRARLDTPTVRVLLEKGFAIDVIKEAIEERLRQTGDDFRNMADLVLATNDIIERRKQHQRTTAYVAGRNDIREGKVEAGFSSVTTIEQNFASNQAETIVNEDEFRNVKLEDTYSASSSGESTVVITRQQAARSQLQKQEKQTLSKYLYTKQEAEKIRQLNRELLEARQCKLCLDAEIGTVILPCGHACTCIACISAVTHCPICRMFIRGTVKIAFD